MIHTRTVDKLLYIFDLPDAAVTGLPGTTSARVMLLYDRNKNERCFKVLSRHLTVNMTGKIESWLEENMAGDDIDYGLNSNESHVSIVKANPIGYHWLTHEKAGTQT